MEYENNSSEEETQGSLLSNMVSSPITTQEFFHRLGASRPAKKRSPKTLMLSKSPSGRYRFNRHNVTPNKVTPARTATKTMEYGGNSRPTGSLLPNTLSSPVQSISTATAQDFIRRPPPVFSNSPNGKVKARSRIPHTVTNTPMPTQSTSKPNMSIVMPNFLKKRDTPPVDSESDSSISSISWNNEKLTVLVETYYKVRDQYAGYFNKKKIDIWYTIREEVEKEDVFLFEVVSKDPLRMKFNKLLATYRQFKDSLKISGGARNKIPKPLTPSLFELIDSHEADKANTAPKGTIEVGRNTEVDLTGETPQKTKRQRRSPAAVDVGFQQELLVSMRQRENQLERIIQIEERKANALDRLVDSLK